MFIQKWLVVNDRGACRITQKRPALDTNEVSIHLELTLPMALFRRPYLKAYIVVPDEAAVGAVIESTVTDNVKDAIEQTTGLNFVISVAPPDAEGDK